MKETVNVNIGSVAFILDEDAYRVLGSYFDDIRRRLPEGAASAEGGTGTESAEQPPLRKLYRSRTERSIAGICGGLAAYFDSDPTLIRLLMLLLILFGGLSIWAYIILWIVIPEEPARKFNINSKNR